MLAAYAESDYESDAVQYDPVTDAAKSFGVFQQKPMYWPTAHQGTLAQCRAFITEFKSVYKHHTGDPVIDCWLVQRWEVPNAVWPKPGPGFFTAKETVNYTRRLPVINQIIETKRLP